MSNGNTEGADLKLPELRFEEEEPDFTNELRLGEVPETVPKLPGLERLGVPDPLELGTTTNAEKIPTDPAATREPPPGAEDVLAGPSDQIGTTFLGSKGGTGVGKDRITSEFDMTIGDPALAQAQAEAARAKQAALQQAKLGFNEAVQPTPEQQQLLEAYQSVAGPEETLELLSTTHKEIRQRARELDEQAELIQSRTIDPTRVFRNGNSVAAAITIAGGYLSQAILGPGSTNAALNIIQAAVDRDVQAQLAELDADVAMSQERRQLLNLMKQSLGEEEAVRQGLRKNYFQVVQTMLQQQRQAMDVFGQNMAFDEALAQAKALEGSAAALAFDHIKDNTIKQKITSATAKQAHRLQARTFQETGKAFPTPFEADPGAAPTRPTGQARQQPATPARGGQGGVFADDPQLQAQARNVERSGLEVVNPQRFAQVHREDKDAFNDFIEWKANVASQWIKDQKVFRAHEHVRSAMRLIEENTDLVPGDKWNFREILNSLGGEQARKLEFHIGAARQAADNVMVGITGREEGQEALGRMSEKDAIRMEGQVSSHLGSDADFVRNLSNIKGAFDTATFNLRTNYKSDDATGRNKFGVGVLPRFRKIELPSAEEVDSE